MMAEGRRKLLKYIVSNLINYRIKSVS